MEFISQYIPTTEDSEKEKRINAWANHSVAHYAFYQCYRGPTFRRAFWGIERLHSLFLEPAADRAVRDHIILVMMVLLDAAEKDYCAQENEKLSVEEGRLSMLASLEQQLNALQSRDVLLFLLGVKFGLLLEATGMKPAGATLKSIRMPDELCRGQPIKRKIACTGFEARCFVRACKSVGPLLHTVADNQSVGPGGQFVIHIEAVSTLPLEDLLRWLALLGIYVVIFGFLLLGINILLIKFR